MKTNTIPQQVKLAPGALSQLPDLLHQYGKKVLLVHGHRPVEDGLLEKVRVLLDEAGFPNANMGQILPNPKYGSVKRGIEIARKENCDIILALGGGSTLQCAKAIGLGLGYKGDVWDFWEKKKKPKHVYPIASILTNPSSASELSENCTIVRKGEQKTIHFPELVCKFAILDPELSMYPSYPTMNQIFGIFEHLFLAYLEQDPPKTKEAADLLKDLRHCSDALAKNINDVEARTELYRVGLLAHTQIGSVKSPFEGLTDRLAFACSLPEGSAGSALFAPWCDSLSKEEKERIAQLGMDMFDFPHPSYEKTIEELTRWFEKMNLPQSLEAAGVKLNKKTIHHIAKEKHQKKVLKKANRVSKSDKITDKKPVPQGPKEDVTTQAVNHDDHDYHDSKPCHHHEHDHHHDNPCPDLKKEAVQPEEKSQDKPALAEKPVSLKGEDTVPPQQKKVEAQSHPVLKPQPTSTPEPMAQSAPLPEEKKVEEEKKDSVKPKEIVICQQQEDKLLNSTSKKKLQNGGVNEMLPADALGIKKEIDAPKPDEKEPNEISKLEDKHDHHHHHHKDHDHHGNPKSEEQTTPKSEPSKEVAIEKKTEASSLETSKEDK